MKKVFFIPAVIILFGCPGLSETTLLPPKNFEVFFLTPTKISLNWTDSNDTEDGYLIEFSKIETGEFTSLATLAPDTESHILENVDSEATRYFRVSAFADDGNTAPSEVLLPVFESSDAGMLIENGKTAVADNNVSISIDVAGVSQMRFSNDGATYSPWGTPASDITWDIGTTEGTHVVYGQFQLTSGEVINRISVVELDLIPPQLIGFTINEGAEYYHGTGTVSLHSQVSGVMEMRVSQNQYVSFDTDWIPYTPTYDLTLDSVSDGYKAVWMQYRDAAGNITEAADNILVDTQPPVVSSFVINPNNAEKTNTNEVSLYNILDTIDGVQMHLSNDNENWTDWMPVAPPGGLSWLLDVENDQQAAEVTKTVYAEYRDAAGNATSVSDSIIYDIMGPELWYFGVPSHSIEDTGTVLSFGFNGAYFDRYRTSSDGVNFSSWVMLDNDGYHEGICSIEVESGNGPRQLWFQLSDGINTLMATQTVTLHEYVELEVVCDNFGLNFYDYDLFSPGDWCWRMRIMIESEWPSGQQAEFMISDHWSSATELNRYESVNVGDSRIVRLSNDSDNLIYIYLDILEYDSGNDDYEDSKTIAVELDGILDEIMISRKTTFSSSDAYIRWSVIVLDE